MSNLINKDKMSGSEFQRIINESTINKTITENQRIEGSLTIGGTLNVASLNVGEILFKKENNSNFISCSSMRVLTNLIIQDSKNDNIFEIENNIIKAKQLSFINERLVIDETGIIKTEYNSSIYQKDVETKQNLVNGAICLSYNGETGIYIGNKTDDKFTNFNKNTFVLLNDRGDTNKIALGINPLHDESNNEISLRDALMFDIIDNDNSLKTYHVYGDHNNHFYPPTGALFIKYDSEALDYDSEKGEKGLQVIGTDISSQASNAVYLRSINKDVVEPITSENMSTLWVKSPKDAKNNDIDITERFVFQSGSNSIYKIWGEHNLKRIILNIPDTQEHLFKLEDLGVFFSPKIIKLENCREIFAWNEKYNTSNNIFNSYDNLITVEKDENQKVLSFRVKNVKTTGMFLATFYGGEV